MTTLAIAGLTLAALAAVGFPLVGARREAADDDDAGLETDALAERKDSLYGDIHDLELDRRTGKVAEADYETMRRSYEIEAARVLERLELGAGNAARTDTCGSCGAAVPAAARFCPGCGAELAAACPACGARAAAEHRFCGACGASMPVPAAAGSRKGGRR